MCLFLVNADEGGAVVAVHLLTVVGLCCFLLSFLPSLLFSWLLSCPEVGSLLSTHSSHDALATSGLQLGYPKQWT